METKWEAIYHDGTSLQQYGEDGEERLFKHISQDKLKEFRLYHQGKIIVLFIETGTFSINGLIYDSDISCQDTQYRLVYFMRKQQIMGTFGVESREGKTKYHVGFQTIINNQNHKRIISVCDSEIQFVSE